MSFNAQKSKHEKRSDQFCRAMKTLIKITDMEMNEEILRTKMKDLEHSIADKNDNIEKISSVVNKLEADLNATCYGELR